ncbi:MAG: glycosyltransferase family 4 protein, partial [Nitrospinota bacterium]
SLRPTVDTHVQDTLSKVKASVTCLSHSGVKANDFWDALEETAKRIPNVWASLKKCEGEEYINVHQALQLAGYIVEKKITHLHAHFATSATSVARLAASFASIPYSFTSHAKDIFHEDVDSDDLEKKFNDAESAVTISDFNLRYLKSRYDGASKKAVRIYNGLDLNRFSYTAPGKAPRQILAVGPLIEKKGFKYLVQACKVLSNRGVEFNCKIIGTGDLEADLKKMVTDYGLENHLSLAGQLPPNKIIEEIEKSSVFVAPSVVGTDGSQDGLPTVLLKTMALGVPCISTDITAIPELVQNGETGLLVPQHDPIALAKAVELLLNDQQLQSRLSENGRKLIEKSFNVETNAAKMRKLFDRKAVQTGKSIKKEVVSCE